MTISIDDLFTLVCLRDKAEELGVDELQLARAVLLIDNETILAAISSDIDNCKELAFKG